MNIALCAIGRLENAYAREFVSHHLRLGFDHVYVADNNRHGEERFEDVLGDLVRDGRVTVTDFRDRESAQREAYNELYRRYGRRYDWMAFFDFDELLCLADGLHGIRQVLETLEGRADCVMVPWMMMDDAGLLRYDGRPMLERFTRRCSRDFEVGKCIVRGGIPGLRFTSSVHVPKVPALRCVLPTGEPTAQRRSQPCDFSVAWLKHFSTKTAEEWVRNKMRKGTAGRPYGRFLEQYRDYFFLVNERTPEKEALIRELERESGIRS